MFPVKTPVRHDPAPSLTKYRLERLWLRPSVQSFVRRGAPILLLSVVFSMLVSNPTIRSGVANTTEAVRQSVAARPELAVHSLIITGASDALNERIAATLALTLPISALDLDLRVLRQKIALMEPVEKVSLRIGETGILEITVAQRLPSVIWRSADGLYLINGNGKLVDRILARADRPDLALIVGIGADRHVDEAMDLLRIAAPLSARIRGLVRIGARRWDLVLDRGQIIRLPETDPHGALARVLALNAAEDLLERDVVVIDMRDGRRPVLRLGAPALNALRHPEKVEGDDV